MSHEDSDSEFRKYLCELRDAWKPVGAMFHRFYVDRLAPEWPPYPKNSRAELARYISPQARWWVDVGPSRAKDKRSPLERLELIRSVYNSLAEPKRIRYALEPFLNTVSRQRIRTPGEVLEILHEGTCVDLAALFCGICLGYELLPVLVRLNGHVLALVSLSHDLKEWDLRSDEFKAMFRDGPLVRRDRFATLCSWIDPAPDSGAWQCNGGHPAGWNPIKNPNVLISVECTGFAWGNQHGPSTGRREQGSPRTAEDRVLTFEEAVRFGYGLVVNSVATEPIVPEVPSVAFDSALDVAVAHNELGYQPYPLAKVPGLGEFQAYRAVLRLVSFTTATLFLLGFLGVWWWSGLRARASALEERLISDVELKELRKNLARGPLIRDQIRYDFTSRMRTSASSDLSQLLTESPARGRERSRMALSLFLLGETSGLLGVFNSGGAPFQPQARASAIQGMAPVGVPLDWTLSLCDKPADLDPSILQALVLSLGDYPAPEVLRRLERLLPILRERWHDDDPGVHAATDWLLRTRLGAAGRALSRELTCDAACSGTERLREKDPGKRQWYVDPSGITMIYLPPDSFFMGNPELTDIEFQEAWKPAIWHKVTLSRPFAISMTEVTRGQVSTLIGSMPKERREHKGWVFVRARQDVRKPEYNDYPAGWLSWDRAAELCTLLDTDPDLACYAVSPTPGGDDLRAEYVRSETQVDIHLTERNGFRLPTEEEWEYAARAYSLARYCFGGDAGHVRHYARAGGVNGPVAVLRPNLFGLFDVHGGIAEWCDGEARPYDLPEGDGQSPDSSEERAVRGGSFEDPLDKSNLYVYTRGMQPRSQSQAWSGFRVARTIKPSVLFGRESTVQHTGPSTP